MNQKQIQNRIVGFLRGITGEAALDAASDLADAGATDSLTMMDLLVFIESEFQLRLTFADLTADVFRTAESLAALIAMRIAPRERSEAA